VPQAADTPTDTYHFILTVQNRHGVTGTRSDVIDLTVGTPRDEVMDQLTDHYFPNSAPLAVLFFGIRPNRI